jgi:hypothetical protein
MKNGSYLGNILYLLLLLFVSKLLSISHTRFKNCCLCVSDAVNRGRKELTQLVSLPRWRPSSPQQQHQDIIICKKSAVGRSLGNLIGESICVGLWLANIRNGLGHKKLHGAHRSLISYIYMARKEPGNREAHSAPVHYPFCCEAMQKLLSGTASREALCASWSTASLLWKN